MVRTGSAFLGPAGANRAACCLWQCGSAVSHPPELALPSRGPDALLDTLDKAAGAISPPPGEEKAAGPTLQLGSCVLHFQPKQLTPKRRPPAQTPPAPLPGRNGAWQIGS